MESLHMRRDALRDLPGCPLPPGYTLRRALTGDADALAGLLTRAFPESPWDSARVRRELLDDPNVHAVFLIEWEATPVATASALHEPDLPETGTLHWVGADPDHAGKRLGASVSLAVLEAFARAGCQSALLRTDDHRLAAIATYRRLGFVPALRDAEHAARWRAVDARLADRNRPEGQHR